jgi:hypothetical protein
LAVVSKKVRYARSSSYFSCLSALGDRSPSTDDGFLHVPMPKIEPRNLLDLFNKSSIHSDSDAFLELGEADENSSAETVLDPSEWS